MSHKKIKTGLITVPMAVIKMLKTSHERVKILKAGIDGKIIEKLYLIYNNFKIVPIPVLFELIEINIYPLNYDI